MSDTFDKDSKLLIAREDLEQGKFGLTKEEKVGVRLLNELTAGVDYNTIDFSYPNSTTIVAEYKKDSDIIRTVQVEFTDATLCKLLKVTYV